MKLYYFLKASFRDVFITIIIGFAAFVVTLITTLSMASAIVVFLLFVASAIFKKSFSRGWLFLLAIILLLPSMRITGATLVVHDVFLVILAVIGLGMILVDNLKFPLAAISYRIFLLELVGLSIIIFAKVFGQKLDSLVWLIMILIAMFWIISTTFQYFFQTQKRLHRFFILLITVGLIHSVFGLVAFLFGFQTPAGLGISSGKIQFLFFENIRYQINGFLGDGYNLRVGNNPLAPFLLISIPLTIALFFNARKHREVSRPLKKIEKTVHGFNTEKLKQKTLAFFEETFKKLKRTIKSGGLSLVKISSNKAFICLILTIQLVALILTFSYQALIILSIGIFSMGILSRNKKLLSVMAVIVIVLTLIFPSVFSEVARESEIGISKWFSGWESIQKNWIWGGGWKIDGEEIGEIGSVKNSYILLWTHFGILGLAIFLSILWRYFKDVYNSYRTSDGEKRFWLIAIFAIFLEFLLLGFISTSYFFGPAALVFWLLYGATENLRRKKVVFGITETRLSEKKQKTLF